MGGWKMKLINQVSGKHRGCIAKYKENKKRKSLFVSLASVAAPEKDLYPIGGQAWQREDDRGSVALWGLIAMHKSPTWKSYKDWHWLWHRATD